MRPVAAGEVLAVDETATTALVVGATDITLDEVITGVTEVVFVDVSAADVDVFEDDVDRVVEDCTGTEEEPTPSRH